MKITLYPVWQAETVFCIAGGPSLTQKQVNKSKGYKVIAINDAYKLAPWADMLYACDRQWWQWHNGCPYFKGYKLQHHSNDMYPGIDSIESDGVEGFSLDWSKIRTGGNSGYQAIHIAIHLGASKIILLGYDMHANGDKSHWFGEHPIGRQSDSRYVEWIPRFEALKKVADARDIKIINRTPNSALECFCKE